MSLTDMHLAEIRKQAGQAEEFITCNTDVPVPEDVDRFFLATVPLLLADVERQRASARRECTALCSDIEKDRDELAAQLAKLRAELQSTRSLLGCLYAAGVEQWAGHDEAVETWRKFEAEAAVPAAPVPAPADESVLCGHQKPDEPDVTCTRFPPHGTPGNRVHSAGPGRTWLDTDAASAAVAEETRTACTCFAAGSIPASQCKSWGCIHGDAKLGVTP